MTGETRALPEAVVVLFDYATRIADEYVRGDDDPQAMGVLVAAARAAILAYGDQRAAAEREAAEARGREAAFAVLDAAIIRLHNMITEDVPPDDDPDDHVPTLHLAIHRDVLGTWRAVLDDGRATPPDAVRDTPSAALTVLAAAALDADADAGEGVA